MPAAGTDCDVVVLGAGPAGLAAAWYAARRGFRVVVIDHAAHVGGLAASLVVDGQSVDHGSHRLHPSIRPDILRDLRVEVGIDLQWRPRHGRIRLHDRWLAFPLEPADVLRSAAARFASGVARDAALGPIRRAVRRDRHGVGTFASEVRRNLGPTIYDSFYGPYARKLWGVDGDELSSELFARRVSARSSSAILRRMFRRGGPPGFWYPTRGFGAICEGLSDGLRRSGATVSTNTSVSGITTSDDRALVTLVDGSSIAARTVVSTIPPAALVRLLDAPQSVQDAADRLTFRGAVLVYLSVAVPRYTPFDAHYFPESTTVVSRLSEPKHYRESDRDPADRTVLCAELPATPGDALWSGDDDVVARRVVRELGDSALPHLEPTASFVVRRTHVYPVYLTGHDRHRAVVDEYVQGRTSVVALGRQATFAHDNTHHALLMGRELAHLLRPDATLDDTGWRTMARQFADHVVED